MAMRAQVNDVGLWHAIAHDAVLTGGFIADPKPRLPRATDYLSCRASIFMTVADDTMPSGFLSPSVTTATPPLWASRANPCSSVTSWSIWIAPAGASKPRSGRTIAANLIPALLPRFVLDRPGIEIELLDIDSRNVRMFVETGQADLGIAGRPQSSTPVTFQPLFRDRFKVICSSQSDMAIAAEPVHWSDLEGENLILNGASEKIESLHYRALAERASMQVRNVTSLLALAKTGFGTTLLPALTAVDLPDGVTALDLADEEIWRVVGLLSHGDSVPSPVAFAFRQFVLDALPELARTLGLQLEPI